MTIMNYFSAAVLAGSVGMAMPVAAQQKAQPKTSQQTAPAAEDATSGPISVQDVKVQLFLERSGTLSESIVGSKKKFFNTVIGQGDAGEPADAVMVTLVFQGTKNTKGSDKLARDLAQVKVTQTTKAGNRILLNRVYGGFLFGESGLAHKAFILDNATCAPLEVEAKIGKTRKLVKIDFDCDLKS